MTYGFDDLKDGDRVTFEDEDGNILTTTVRLIKTYSNTWFQADFYGDTCATVEPGFPNGEDIVITNIERPATISSVLEEYGVNDVNELELALENAGFKKTSDKA
jgi:hypothetical protein